MKSLLRTLLFSLLMAGAVGLFNGCATDGGADTVETKPWNTPQNWEGPMPSTINQGR